VDPNDGATTTSETRVSGPSEKDETMKVHYVEYDVDPKTLGKGKKRTDAAIVYKLVR